MAHQTDTAEAMICPNCESESLTRTAAVEQPNWRCDDCGVQFAVLNPSLLVPVRHCDECRWFSRGKCRKGHAMDFRMPGSDPHNETAGFHRFECRDFWKQDETAIEAAFTKACKEWKPGT